MAGDLIIRPERPADREVIRAVQEAAFERPNEADLVDALRREARPFLSLVAERDGTIVGHICFTPVTIVPAPPASDRPPDRDAGSDPARAMGLAPVAVVPSSQREGVGSSLVYRGLAECRRLGGEVVVVLGHPSYYPRFGFRAARPLGLTCEYLVPDEVFMALELQPGALARHTGLVRYHPVFALV
jgi:putative acetyltransferase